MLDNAGIIRNNRENEQIMSEIYSIRLLYISIIYI